MLEELLEIETQGWRALSSEMEVAREFYGRLLSDEAIMLFPGGMVLEGKNQILESFAAQPWDEFDIQEPQVVPLGGAAAVLVYKVRAWRSGSSEYRALISSAYYQRDGEWILGCHQHTPI